MRAFIERILELGARPVEVPAEALPLPTLWLLGKTGAGKSSLVRALTGEAEVGQGFAPCTRTARAFDYPQDQPVLRFLDTRGLGEAGYDPAEDLAEAERGAHAVLLVMRLDDPVQGPVLAALGEARRHAPKLPVLAVHTGADLMPDEGALTRARAAQQKAAERTAGTPLPSVTLALPEGGRGEAGIDDLRNEIAAILPDLALLMLREETRDNEARRFAELRPMVLWYAGAAGASDAAPLVGAVSVPALQGAMLHALAGRHGYKWTPARAALFASALGAGAVAHYAGAHALRQGVKMVPFIGQTLGAAAAAGASFAATYALGRVASAWLYRAARGEVVDRESLRKLHEAALRRARDAAG
ncbi:MAG: 50S ribosome-binding GTPase [Pararhodobacter sp.]|nr:50S ribosome-binding GTPase [Pararhodobacter sp.]